MNPVSNSKSTYRSEIDGLRAFAVLSVVAFHAFPSWLKGGFIGVDIFFVISGFLITSHIFESLEHGSFSFTDFFGRRVRRIFPALIIVMLVSLTFGWFILVGDEFSQLGKHISSGAVFITNFLLVGESGYFDTVSEKKPMLHLWSLAVEEQFYIIWPLVLWFSFKKKFNLLTITIIVLTVSFYFNVAYIKSKPIETFFLPMGRFWELLSGSILAWFFLYKKELLTDIKMTADKYLIRIFYSDGDSNRNDGSTFSNLVSVIGFTLLLYGCFRFDRSLSFPSYWAVIPVLGAMLIILSGPGSFLNRLFLMNPVAVWIGLISYPLYLWHWPILSFLHIINDGTPHRDARVLAVLFSVFFAWLTYRFIERPIRSGSFNFKKSTFSLSLLLIVVGAFSYFSSVYDWSKTHIFENRLIKRDGAEHAFGTSMKWYRGSDDWLYLGNDYLNTVAKLKLAITPSKEEVDLIYNQFSLLANAGSVAKTQVALLVGPNKSSVYSEYLPRDLNPSNRRYVSYFTDKLESVSNLEVVDPTYFLRERKKKDGNLYWRTDTHWNQKGAYVSFCLLMERLGLICPEVSFELEGKFSGGLIEISKLDDFPIHSDDNWKYEILADSETHRVEFQNQPKSAFGWKGIVSNSKALNEMSVWIIGDSFTKAMRPYIEASFKEVHYIGHWEHKLDTLPSELLNSDKKPDLILVVRVERSF